ncbi:hypothetical protein ASF28_07665 [Methylobacterium sp. Leaf99]|uniref:BrnT family toxin n=1 Tax=Methylobacterium sp. Leaf99 TaxID=1736251 RepID=UPI0006F7D4CC|nr:BrnT family toxin [Methylobacterium sp. Leaf99]KQP10940.1 hypothetical protein ASF28_07665 [Methylobacterium sp. Leaf99]
MLVVRDEPKREKNRQAPPIGHGLDFADARDRFVWKTALVVSTYASARGGVRSMAIGFLDGSLVALTFSLLGREAISIVSLRTASNRERKAYAKQSQA